MGLLRWISKLIGIEHKVKWSNSKVILVIEPLIFGMHLIFVDADWNIVIFLPKSDRTLHVLKGYLFRAKNHFVFDINGDLIQDEVVSEKYCEWKINPKSIWYRGLALGANPRYIGKVENQSHFKEKINDDWITYKTLQILDMMKFGKELDYAKLMQNKYINGTTNNTDDKRLPIIEEKIKVKNAMGEEK